MSKMSWLIILIGVGVLGLSDAFLEKPSQAKVSYSQVEKFINGRYVRHMEADLYKKGNLLFAENYALRTTDGSSTQTIVGSTSAAGYTLGRGTSARFHQIFGFCQLNANLVLVADFHYHCIKMVNRLTTVTTAFAGRCPSSGNTNGVGTSARFYYPRKIIRDATTSNSMVILQGNAASHAYLRLLNTATRRVTTVVTSGLQNSFDMTWSPNKKVLYICHRYHVSKVDWATKRVTKVVGSSAATQFGPFSQAKFNYLYEIVHFKDNLYIVAEVNIKRLTIVDMARKVTVPLCFKSKCTLDLSPYSLLLVNGALYVGTNAGIFKLTGYNCLIKGAEVYVKPFESRAKVTYDAAGRTGEFPTGEYKFQSKTGMCSSYTVKVLRGSIARRIAFKVSYAVKCHVVDNAVGKVFLEPVLQHMKADFQEICRSDCVMSKTLKPIYKCSSNLLTITWPTDTAYPENVKQIPSGVSNTLKARLRSSSKRRAELPLFNNIPQLVIPKVGSNGQRIQVVFHNTKLPKENCRG